MTLSAKLSATNEAAAQAARAMDDPAAVTVLDSFSVTMGQGLVAVAAAEAAADGASMGASSTRLSPPESRLTVCGVIDTSRTYAEGAGSVAPPPPWGPFVHQARHRGARGRGGAGVEAAHPGQITEVPGAEGALGRAVGTAGRSECAGS